MVQIMEAKEAVALIRDGDCIGINAFLVIGNADVVEHPLAEQYRETGHPANLQLFCATGFGMWDENKLADEIVTCGAATSVVAGHLSTMHGVMRLAAENRLEVYNLPIGVLAHCLQAAAAGLPGYLTKVGLNLFVDPRVKGPGVNGISTRTDLVKVVEVDGEEFLFYKPPKIDVALIRATAMDENGNISFEDEPATCDALAMAMAARRNGGKVIVQVDHLKQEPTRADQVVIPGILVDAVVVARQKEGRIDDEFIPLLSGEKKVSPCQMDYYLDKFIKLTSGVKKPVSEEKHIIASRAAKELRSGQVVNLGIGTPETIGKYAALNGLMDQITLTVEAGGVGGMPVPGMGFGSTLGADFLCDISRLFDFYDGGGLDACFVGGIEVDQHGNVNAHETAEKFVGIGGFADITQNTKNVFFCLPFRAKGLKVKRDEGGRVTIVKEGTVAKFKKQIRAVSFSAKNAIETGQNVFYITERCVFQLTQDGLKLVEVMPGIDTKAQILDLMEFEVLI